LRAASEAGHRSSGTVNPWPRTSPYIACARETDSLHRASDHWNVGARRSTPNFVHHLTKFGFVAFPADPSEKGYLYIWNENNTIFPSAYTSTTPSDWPTDVDLKKYYIKF